MSSLPTTTRRSTNNKMTFRDKRKDFDSPQDAAQVISELRLVIMNVILFEKIIE